MTLFELFVVALATYHAVKIWRESSLFATWRAFLEMRQDWRIVELLLCRWCLSVWVGFFFAIVAFLPYEWWSWPVKIFAYGLAVSCLAMLPYDVTQHLYGDDGHDGDLKTGFDKSGWDDGTT